MVMGLGSCLDFVFGGKIFTPEPAAGGGSGPLGAGGPGPVLQILGEGQQQQEHWAADQGGLRRGTQDWAILSCDNPEM